MLFFGGLLFGTLIVAIMTASFVDWASLAPSDVRITNAVQYRIWERKLHNHAAKVIQTVVRVYRLRRYFDGIVERERILPGPATMMMKLKWAVKDMDNGRKLRGLQIRMYYTLLKLRKLRRLPAHLVDVKVKEKGASPLQTEQQQQQQQQQQQMASPTQQLPLRAAPSSPSGSSGEVLRTRASSDDVESVLRGQAELLRAIEQMGRSLALTNDKLHQIEVRQHEERGGGAVGLSIS